VKFSMAEVHRDEATAGKKGQESHETARVSTLTLEIRIGQRENTILHEALEGRGRNARKKEARGGSAQRSGERRCLLW